MSAAPDRPGGRPWLKRLVRWAGGLLLVASLGYVALEIARNWQEVARWRPTAGDLAALAALAVGYGLLLYLLAETWHRLVGLFGAEPRPRTYRSYTLTQIARYLPGNVAHLLGRAVVLRDGPLSDRQLGLATLLELAVVPLGAVAVLLAAAVAMPSGAALPAAFGIAPPPWAAPWAAGLALTALAGAALALARRGPEGRRRLRALAVALTLCVLFMAGLGAIFGAILGIVGDGPFRTAAMAGICAWLVGYATPGAPGGLGPREAALVVLLSGTVPAGELLIAAAVFRIVTVLGDVVCFGSGLVLARAWGARTGPS